MLRATDAGHRNGRLGLARQNAAARGVVCPAVHGQRLTIQGKTEIGPSVHGVTSGRLKLETKGRPIALPQDSVFKLVPFCTCAAARMTVTMRRQRVRWRAWILIVLRRKPLTGPSG